MSADQTRLPLERGYPRRAEPISTRYELGSQGLVVYGNWHKLFGCWYVEAGEAPHTSRELLPIWPILPEPGGEDQASTMSVIRHLDKVAITNPEGRDVVIGARADRWFATYLADFPNLVQRLARPFGWKQWLAIDLMNEVPGFWRFLYEETEQDRLGYSGACMALLYSGSNHSRRHRYELGHRMITEPRREFLADLVGSPISRSDAYVISKLAPDAREGEIRRTLDMLAQDDVANVLRHARSVSSELIDVLESLGPFFARANLADLLENGVTKEHLVRVVRIVASLLDSDQLEQAGRAFGNVRSAGEFARWARRWMDRGLERQPFPPPPIEVEPPLRPISSYIALKAEALRMQNCVDTFVTSVMEGEIFFYHWSGDEEASVSFVSTPAGDWRFDQALGFDNEYLESDTIVEIMSHVSLGRPA